jgi:UDP-N-acetylmuramoylalanine--D-glutamate ligase
MGKRIVILGGGESGAGSAVLAMKKGFDVFLSDKGKIAGKYQDILKKNSIEYEEFQHTEEKILNADEVIKSPGISDKLGLIKKLKEKDIPVISEIEFAGRYTKAKMIGITGTNGKTTTTMLTYHILSKAGLNVGLAGNVGKSFALQVAEENYSHYVLELSSFQLDGMFDFKCDIAILTNITPDHLDRYDNSIDKYASSKFRIAQNQTRSDAFVWCVDDPLTNQYINQIRIKARQYPFSIKKKTAGGSLA